MPLTEYLSLIVRHGGDAAHRRAVVVHRRVVVDRYRVVPDAAKTAASAALGEGSLPARFRRAHHPREDERHEAQACVSTDTVWNAVGDRCDLKLGCQHPESALDIGSRLGEATHDVVRAWIFYLGHEHELAVHGIPLPKSRLTVVPSEEEAPRELAGKVLPG